MRREHLVTWEMFGGSSIRVTRLLRGTVDLVLSVEGEDKVGGGDNLHSLAVTEDEVLVGPDNVRATTDIRGGQCGHT